MALTLRQERILHEIEAFIERHGYPPTIREIGRAVGISSTSVVNYHLNKLKKAGVISRDGQVSRGIKLAEALGASFKIPILGVIQAGQPLPVLDAQAAAEVDDQDLLDMTRDIAPTGEGVYALRVKGNSMIDALINDGDIVVMQKAESARNGEMIAAWIKDREETTLKRFYKENGRIRLQPAHPTMEPIYVKADNLEVQGRVIAVIRNLA